ncbi:histidine-containing phosphotransfer protein 1-like isoform X2 [Cucurbita pepo subsp. pepo]|uniref:histidine-containing phosphotransfer protein 1-like isoform X2 n=1 Tax=Cucurbita pepo subsp. pepo TaxID=3664 RepID=UPI000C9D8231|nr:histidine-containing phosphotransfer protein 1-like isoform X2 [Cucurbita pepo subsp. pepo]
MSEAEHPQRHMLNKFINALRDQGFLDENFSSLGNLYDNRNMLALFCDDAEPKLDRVEKSLKNENVDFQGLATIIEQIKGNAARLGGKRVAEACAELQRSCGTSDVERCNEAYKKVNWEYYILRDCFHHILQAERTIRSRE